MPDPTRPPNKLDKLGAARPPPESETAIAKSRRERDELEAECQKLEEELEELKARYEQYFLGVERKEPARWRDELKKRVLRVKEAFTRNTGLRFRLQSLHARFLSYERLWLRSAREKEEGTYRRDVVKARMRARHEEPAAPPPAQSAPPVAARPAAQVAGSPGVAPLPVAGARTAKQVAISPGDAPPPVPSQAGIPGALSGPPGVQGTNVAPGSSRRPATAATGAPSPPTPAPAKQAATSRPPATTAPVPSAPAPVPAKQAATPGNAQSGAGAPGGMSDAQLRALYSSYVAAKRSCAEDVSRLTYDAVARSVSKQIPEIMARFKARSVEFKVEVKNGKAVLKAIPKV